MNVCCIWPFGQISDDFLNLFLADDFYCLFLAGRVLLSIFSRYLAMGQIFCCSIIQGVSFNYHQRNVRSRVSVSSRNLSQVSVSEVTVSTTSLVSTHTRERQHKRLRIASVSSNIFEAVVANKALRTYH